MSGPSVDLGRMRGRWTRKRLLAVLLAAFIALIGLYGYWVGWADPDPVESVDAVVIHAGQRHRLRLGQQLMAEGVAPVMVILYASEAFPDDYQTLCQSTADYQVLCPPAGQGADTLAEAAQIDELAREHQWSRVMIVTSNYHLRRARYLDRKCSDVTVLGVAARPRNLQIRLRAVAKEMVAMPIALVESCPDGGSTDD